jgi:hypothetical protein
MDRLTENLDPYRHDPKLTGTSLVNNAEVLLGCLDAAGARSVVEVGALTGDLTELLLEWAKGSGARVSAIDPFPAETLAALGERDDLELIRETSLEALPRIELPDAVVLDGDHNWYTVTEELRIIEQRSAEATFPLVLFHDVSWPHARRDDYFDPEQIPAEHRQPIAEGGGLHPGEPGTRRGGFPAHFPAAQEGGERNGVLTAAEDFAAGRDDLRLAVVPSFFGLGVLWPLDAPWADAVAAVVDPYDRNPLLERLERNRVVNIARVFDRTADIYDLQEKLAKRDALLNKLLESQTFAVGEQLSRLRQRGEAAYSKDEIRRVLSD